MNVRHFPQSCRFAHGADAPRGSGKCGGLGSGEKLEPGSARRGNQKEVGAQYAITADGIHLDPRTVAGGFLFDNVLCIPVPDANAHYYYLPLNCGLFLNPDGSAQAMLIETGDVSFLQLTALWSPSEETLASLRDELAQLNQFDDPNLVRLSFAPVSMTSARLLLYETSGDARELAQSATSGMAPFNAMFSLTVTPQDRPSVAAAMNGQHGYLGVGYEATLNWPVRHQARLTGELSNLATLADLEAALADQRVVLELADPDDTKLWPAFLDAAAKMLGTLPASISAGQNTALDIDLTIEENLSISAGTDVGSWFPGSDTPVVVPEPGVTPLPQPAPTPDGHEPAAVRLSLPELPGADLSDVVALVIASREDNPQTRVHLTPSAPEATIDLVAADGAILLATQYVTGAAAYEATVTASGGTLALEPGDLGLVAISIDPGPLEDAGADRARLTARYDPEDRDTSDLRTFHFRPPFAPVTWLLVARGAPLGQSLTYEWRATLASGAVERHPETTAANPEIVLSPNIQTED